jgi:uncharacterized protein (TIGR00725 family)
MGPDALPVLAVLGPGRADRDEMEIASRLGALAADHGWVVVSGGGPGVMAAACRGAVEAGGVTVGILPSDGPTEGYPNPWVRIPIFTGVGMARNVVNVLSARLCIAVGGGPGTLSEVALALKAGTPVWCFRSWSIEPGRAIDCRMPRVFERASDLLEALESVLSEKQPT